MAKQAKTTDHAAALAKNGTTVRACVDRIVATFDRATPRDIEEGSTWYADGEALCATLAGQSNYSVETCAAVVAHLSPRTTWARNVAGATALLLTGRALPECLTANVARARVAMDSADPLGTLNGPKTRRFALNILGDREAVTVDVWAARIALGADIDPNATLARRGVYAALEHCYRVAARRIGVDPVTVQATTWVVARRGMVTRGERKSTWR